MVIQNPSTKPLNPWLVALLSLVGLAVVAMIAFIVVSRIDPHAYTQLCRDEATGVRVPDSSCASREQATANLIHSRAAWVNLPVRPGTIVPGVGTVISNRAVKTKTPDDQTLIEVPASGGEVTYSFLNGFLVASQLTFTRQEVDND